LELLTSEHPDLVLSDVRMPEMDGYSLARAIRADPALQAIPVVFYTAHYIAEQNLADAAALGVNRIIEKTGDLEELLAAVADALGAET
jgi:CheY-like chemotaxis protein